MKNNDLNIFVYDEVGVSDGQKSETTTFTVTKTKEWLILKPSFYDGPNNVFFSGNAPSLNFINKNNFFAVS